MIDLKAENAAKALLRAGWVLVTAESCTGGLVAQRLTALSGSSEYFDRGYVVYSNLAKQQMLGVSPALLARDGAVSESVVLAMARGALASSGASAAVAVSGIAGPTGGTPHKPVGTVWLGFATAVAVDAEHKLYQGTREAVRMQAADDVLDGLATRCLA